jgi:hypothetical protein
MLFACYSITAPNLGYRFPYLVSYSANYAGKAGQPFTTFSTIVSLPTTLSYYTKSPIAEWNFTA